MRLWKKLLAVIATASLLLGLAAPAFAAYPDGVQAAAERMHTLGLIQGKGGPDLALGDNLTRAEAVTIIVRAFGKADDAKLLKGAPAYPDTANHWASGEIALAKNIIEANGQSMGMPDGTFAPNGQLTVAQTVAFLLKFLGVKFTSDANWINNAFQAAVDAGVMSADDAAALKPQANTNATRGTAFYLADNAFAGYKLPAGKTVYQIYQVPNPPALNVAKVDATTTESSITITGTVDLGASLWVNSPANAITPAADGSFSYTADLSMGDNTFTFGAADLVGNVTTSKVTVTRTVGAVATVDASDITVTAGGSVAFAPVVKDAKGNVISGADVTVTSDLGTYADDQFTAGTKAGTGTATVKVGDLSKDVNVTVNAGDLATLTVTPATADLAAGASQKFTVAGLDANGNAVATPSVTWSASKGVMGPDGTFGATSDAAGTVTVTATAGSVSGTASVNVFGAASKVVIAAPAAVVANGESSGTLTATVVDANGNTVKDYTGTITFASSAASVDIDTATVAAAAGQASTTFTASSTSATVLSASASGLLGSTVTFTPSSQVVTSVKATISPATLAAVATGSTGTITLTLQDQTGNDMLDNTSTDYTVHLTSSDTTIANFGGGAAVDVTISHSAGSAAARTSSTQAISATSKVGGVTVTAAVTAPSGSAVTVNSVSLNTQVVGDAYKLSIDAIADSTVNQATAQTAKIRVLDFNGNQLTTGTVTGIAVSRVDANGSSTSLGTVNASNGVATLGNVQSGTTTAGAYTLTASYSGLISAPAVSFNVLPAAAYRVYLSASPSSLSANGSSTSTLKATIYDAYDNKVTSGSYPILFHKVDGTGTASFADTTVNTVDGVATVTVTATTNVSLADHFTATTASLNGGNTTVSTGIFGSPYKLAFGTITSNPVAGTVADVNVAVKDAATSPAGGNTLTYDNGRAVSVTVKDSDGVVVGTFTGTTANGVADVEVNLTKSGTYSMTATSTGLSDATGGSVSFVAASPVSVALSADVSTISARSTATAAVTAKLKDQYGNTATNKSGSPITVTLTPDTTSYGSIAASVSIANLASSAASTNFAANGVPGTTTITASATGLASGTLAVTSVITGNDVASLQLGSVSDTAASVSTAPEYNAVTVTTLDGNNNRMTTNTDSVTFTITSGSTGTTKVYSSVDGGANWTDSGSATTATVATIVKGSVMFAVIDTKADTVNFTVNDTTASKSTTGSVKFVAGDAAGITVDASTPTVINGNGIALDTVTARVTDTWGNTVSSASGTMTFAIKSGADYATLQSTTAPILNGIATVVAQSKVATNNGSVQVVASTDWDADSVVEDSTPTTVFTVEGSNPSATISLSGITDVATVIPDMGAKTFTANVSVSAATISSVKFEAQNTADNGPWVDLGTDTTGPSYSVNTNAFLDGKTYTFRVTVTDAAGRTYQITRGPLTVTDTSAPAVVGTPVVANGGGVAGAGVIGAGDTITVNFSEPIAVNGTALAATDFTIANGHSFGTGATFTWSNSTTLVITLGTTPTIVESDTVALAVGTKLQDTATVVHDLGTGTIWTVPAATSF